MATTSPVVVSSIANACWRACKSHPNNWPIRRRFSDVLLLCGSSAVVKRQRGGACRGAAMCGDRSHRLADGDTFLADDVLTPVPDRSRGDRRPGYLWGTRARAADVNGQHSGGPGGIRAANPAG